MKTLADAATWSPTWSRPGAHNKPSASALRDVVETHAPQLTPQVAPLIDTYEHNIDRVTAFERAHDGNAARIACAKYTAYGQHSYAEPLARAEEALAEIGALPVAGRVIPASATPHHTPTSSRPIARPVSVAAPLEPSHHIVGKLVRGTTHALPPRRGRY